MSLERELLKLPLDQAAKSKSFTANFTPVNILDVGGHSLLLKQRVDLSVTGRFGTKHGFFIAKVDFSNNGPDYILSVIKANQLARSHQLPVPPTTRFFTDNNFNPGVLMTDMTAGGRYWLWGANNDFHKQELETLQSMELYDENSQGQIKSQAQYLAGVATKADLFLNFGSYHLRREKNTGELDVVLLDFADFTYDHGTKTESELWNLNQRHLNDFIKLYTERAALCLKG